MTRQHDDERTPSRVSRRGFITFAAGGVGGVMLGSVAMPAFGATSPTPKLAGEYFRKANQVTPAGTRFDNINVRINGDVARIHVPQTVKPKAGPVPVVWFYHGSGSDHNALDGGFKSYSAAVVNRGWIAICQTAGGTKYSHPDAVALQVAGYAYLSGQFNISANYLRATSGGGPLATEAYARDLIPNVRGMYHVNSLIDVRDKYNRGGDGRRAMIAVFGDNPAAIDAANPMRHPASAWAGKKFRVIADPNDDVVPAQPNAVALRNLALPVAAEASQRGHASGHNTPSFTLADFGDALNRWAAPAPSADTQAPVVTMVAPVGGATIKGTTTVIVKATDNVGVVDVGLYIGTRRMGTCKNSGSDWRLTLSTKTSATPNGTYDVTAQAKDAAGNVGVSAPVRVTVKN